MKNLLVASLLFFSLFCSDKIFAQVFKSNSGEISFFSKTPMENIDAHNTSVNSFVNTTKKEIVFMVPVRSFEFKKKLMQEHFNENYMESDQFPSASFSGNIQGDIDFSKPGIYQVTAIGKLKMHGVEKEIAEKGKITVSEDHFNIEAKFNVLLKDYQIEIPKIVFKNIAESMEVKVNINYIPYKKDK